MPDTLPGEPDILSSAPSMPKAANSHVTNVADLDRLLDSWRRRLSGGRSPSIVGLALLDWAAHTADTPYQTGDFARKAMTPQQHLVRAAMGQASAIVSSHDDRRFSGLARQQSPYRILSQAVLLGGAFWICSGCSAR